MNEQEQQALLEEWDRRWEGADRDEGLTLLGKRMFRAKLKVIRTLLNEIEVGGVIEVGCGLGHTLALYRELGYPALGIDPSANAIRVCEAKGLPCRQMRLDEVTERYDLVSSDGMLEHFLNFEPFAQEMMRVSRRYVLLIQPNHGSFVGKTLVYLAELLRGDVNMFEYNYRIQDFIDVFARHGFDCVRNQPAFMDVFRVLLFARRGDDA